MACNETERVLAPAKVNLYLRVLGRRADGYHLIDSLMVPIDLCDELTISARRAAASRVTLTCDCPDVPPGPDNLVHRAAELFLERTSTAAEVHIDLTKCIPTGSGLGGGSSDAAATLHALNRVLSTGCTVSELSCWAVELGADVPFFVCGSPARVEGIGEIVTPVMGFSEMPMVVCFPGVGLSTAAVYEGYDRRPCPDPSLTKPLPATSIQRFASSREHLQELLVNDLEAVAAEACAELLSLKKELIRLGAQAALMTGSGSAVFGVWPTWPAAERAARTMCGRGVWAAGVRTLEQSPATAWWAVAKR